jgi:hypothetical protein
MNHYLVLLLVYFSVLGVAWFLYPRVTRGWLGDAKRGAAIVLLIFQTIWSILFLALGLLMFYGPDHLWKL